MSFSQRVCGKRGSCRSTVAYLANHTNQFTRVCNSRGHNVNAKPLMAVILFSVRSTWKMFRLVKHTVLTQKEQIHDRLFNGYFLCRRKHRRRRLNNYLQRYLCADWPVVLKRLDSAWDKNTLPNLRLPFRDLQNSGLVSFLVGSETLFHFPKQINPKNVLLLSNARIQSDHSSVKYYAKL